MKRPLRPDELTLWGLVTATVRPHGPRPAPTRDPDPAMPKAAAYRRPGPARGGRADATLQAAPRAGGASNPTGAGGSCASARTSRARLDLHGYDQDRARAALHGFISRAHADGARAVLVVTGKGRLGDGVLRRRVPEWLAEAPSRPLVAGLSAGRPPPRRRRRALCGAEAAGIGSFRLSPRTRGPSLRFPALSGGMGLSSPTGSPPARG